MIHLLHNLSASGDSDSVGKMIGVAVVVLIGLINVIASAVKKQQEQKQRERVREQIERGASGSPTPIRQAPQQPQRQSMQPMRAVRSVPVRPPVLRQQPQPRAVNQPIPQKGKPKKQRATVGQTSPVAAAIVSAVEARERSEAAAAPTAHRPASLAVDARAVARWLTPATLRQQFILTEVLQPPVALRDTTSQSP